MGEAYTFTILATDANGCSGTREFTLNVNEPEVCRAPWPAYSWPKCGLANKYQLVSYTARLEFWSTENCPETAPDAWKELNLDSPADVLPYLGNFTSMYAPIGAYSIRADQLVFSPSSSGDTSAFDDIGVGDFTELLAAYVYPNSFTGPCGSLPGDYNIQPLGPPHTRTAGDTCTPKGTFGWGSGCVNVGDGRSYRLTLTAVIGDHPEAGQNATCSDCSHPDFLLTQAGNVEGLQVFRWVSDCIWQDDNGYRLYRVDDATAFAAGYATPVWVIQTDESQFTPGLKYIWGAANPGDLCDPSGNYGPVNEFTLETV